MLVEGCFRCVVVVVAERWRWPVVAGGRDQSWSKLGRDMGFCWITTKVGGKLASVVRQSK